MGFSDAQNGAILVQVLDLFREGYLRTSSEEYELNRNNVDN